MGSASRRRKRTRAMGEALTERIMASSTPQHEAVTVLGELRMAANPLPSTKPKPRHVLAKESSGHKYVKGDKARSPMLTTEEKRLNRAVHKTRTNRALTDNRVPTDVQGSPEKGERLVKGVRVMNRTDLSEVRVAHTDPDAYKRAQQRRKDYFRAKAANGYAEQHNH